MRGWETVIGLETHVQLRTLSKMFCGCSAAFGPPNTNVCPCASVCQGAPRAERAGVETRRTRGAGVGCSVHPRSVFARKKLLLPRPAEGLPDLAVRAAARDPRDAVVTCRPIAESPPPRSSASTSRGCGEVAARPLPQADGDRPEPVRRAAHRDRHRAGFPVAPRGPRVPPHPQAGARVRRDFGLRHGKGACAWTRTSPCATPARPRSHKTEVKNINSFGTSRKRSPSSGIASRRARGRGTVAPQTMLYDSRPTACGRSAARKRATTTAISRTPTCRRSS